MAMRKRGSGTGKPSSSRSAGVRPVFEDFKPISEWEQDDESHSLVIYLPGFMREQIKVSTEGRNMIQVSGERLVAGNKWSRFQEDFQIPENCEINSISAKYQGANLIIRVPKKEVDKGTKSPNKPGENFSPKNTNVDATLQKGQDKVLPQNSSPTGTTELPDEKNMREQKILDDQRDKDNTTLVSNPNNLVLQDIALKEDHAASNRQQGIIQAIMGDKERKNLEQREELPHFEYVEKKKFQKDKAVGVELNEERQLLVNMGVAVLVIVALSAYVTYKFASGKAKV